ncbi:transposase [Mycolicibacterium gilvum]|uniref:transposase n=1 Tax=Mycolicibacterium gilvum TaxID=1804 RepID=UPI001300DCAE
MSPANLRFTASIRAAAFAAHSLSVERFPDAEHLYSATGLVPDPLKSATLSRRGRISRQGLAEHRDALMGMAWDWRKTHDHSPSATRNCGPVPWPRSRPASRLPGTRAAWPID